MILWHNPVFACGISLKTGGIQAYFHPKCVLVSAWFCQAHLGLIHVKISIDSVLGM